jgi:hypothetical protein
MIRHLFIKAPPLDAFEMNCHSHPFDDRARSGPSRSAFPQILLAQSGIPIRIRHHHASDSAMRILSTIRDDANRQLHLLKFIKHVRSRFHDLCG